MGNLTIYYVHNYRQLLSVRIMDVTLKGIDMSLGLSTAWRSKQPKQKRCDRCELYFPKSLAKCIHCSALDGSELAKLKAQHQATLEDNSTFGKYLLFGAAVIGLLLLVSFL